MKMALAILVPLVAAMALGPTGESEDPNSLRFLAAMRGLRIGVSVEPGPLRTNRAYRELVAREFSILTPENALKFGPVHPTRNRYAFSGMDTIVAFAQAHRMEVRGHTLLWHEQLPRWLVEGGFTRDQLIDILHEHIRTVVGRYRGRIKNWDVVNEAVGSNGELRNTFWVRNIGPEVVSFAFRWAREADPDALLFYNDFGAEGLGPKSDAVYALLASLKAVGVPIDGIGLQSHEELRSAPSEQELAANMQRLAQLGLRIQITEMDVRIEGPPSSEELDQQAQIYRRFLDACLGQHACTAFIGWNVYDGASWIPAEYPGFGWAHLFDEEFRPKPAYFALQDALRTGSGERARPE